VFLTLLKRYSLKITFALTLLIGLQFPHFLTLYETRLDAHYQESLRQLSQYQKLADLLFEGDLQALLGRHKNSNSTLFKAETSIIEALVSRTDFLTYQKNSLQGSPVKRYTFLLTQINKPLFLETKNNYQANIVLNTEAIVVGLIIATVLTLLLECLFLICPFLFYKMCHNPEHKSATKKN
tara:strand:+ start:7528 stop:8070 length:543 start_codon:yes stop_codon:yes gene_type:complete